MADSNTYRAFALFVQGERVLNCTEYTPVDMKIIEDDFKTGAMDTAITLDGGMEKMSASFKVSGSDSGVMGYLGLIPGSKFEVHILTITVSILNVLIHMRGLLRRLLMTRRGLIQNQQLGNQ